LKNKTPGAIIRIGGLLTFLACFLIFSIFTWLTDVFDFWSILFISGLVALINYIIFYIFVQQFLSQRLKILYRIIRKGKITEKESFFVSMRENVLDSATKETASWALERQKEINKLKEQEAFRREFLGNLAHELKTPVFSIQGYILTLLEGGLEDDNVNRKFLERASLATDRISSILEDLDTITKLEVDQIVIQLSQFDIVDLAKEVMESLEVKANEKNNTLRFKEKYEPIMVRADRVRIAQVLTNLIANAINYGNEGGKTDVRFYTLDDAIVVEVSDNGPGIAEKDLPRLFERFYRVEQSRNRNQGGSGLGLAIVKHIVETQHGQTLNVRSTEGVGSTFSFTLEKG
jgi:two-component system phosphate regulon sensor histidine kinase PhoR